MRREKLERQWGFWSESRTPVSFSAGDGMASVAVNGMIGNLIGSLQAPSHRAMHGSQKCTGAGKAVFHHVCALCCAVLCRGRWTLRGGKACLGWSRWAHGPAG